MSAHYIFTMHRLGKAYPPDKEVLKDITLAFYPGAKIGVLGYNGSGKSTLLRIMAQMDTEYRGEAQLAPGATGSTSSPRTTTTPPPTSSPDCNPRSTPRTRGTSTRSSSMRWMPFACPRPTLT